MRPEGLYLSDIVEASEIVAVHIGNSARDEFIADRTARAAVLHELTVIGEATARIPVAVRDRFPSVPWPDIVAWSGIDEPIVTIDWTGVYWRKG